MTAEAWRRKSIALKDKLLIVNDLKTGKNTQTSICRERDLPKSTVATICIPHVDVYNCERSELSGLFNGTDFLYNIIYIYFRPYVVP